MVDQATNPASTDFAGGINRLYRRYFKSAADVEEFIEAAELITERVSAVNMRYQLIQSLEDPCLIFEIWTYPDEKTMRWVQAAMEAASVIPRKFGPETEIWTSRVRLDMRLSD